MHESRNATHFAGTQLLRGIAACAAFGIGTVMGGRRPRTLIAIRLADVKLTARPGRVGDEQFLIPNVHIMFRQEKHDDIQGARKGYDMPHSENCREIA